VAPGEHAVELERWALKLASRPTAVVLSAIFGIFLLGTVLGGVAYWRSASRGLPYHDSFSSGKAEEWTAFGGTWELAANAMRNDSDERGAKLLTGSSNWTNYSIEADLMLLGLGGDAGLVIRSGQEEEGVDAYNGYYAGLRTIDNTLVLGRAEYGWTEVNFPLIAHGLRVEASRWYHLKLLAYGCQIVAAAGPREMPGVVSASITDQDCVRSGRVGLRSYSAGGVWENVAVRPATAHDLDKMLALGHTRRIASSSGSARVSTSVSQSPPADNVPRALSSSPNTIPIRNLRLAVFDGSRIATVRGVVILNAPAVFVQDATGGVDVKQAHPQPLKVGDEVEVTGKVRASSFSSTLEDATVRVLWEATPMPPAAITASQAATGSFDATYIEVSGRLRNKAIGPGDEFLFDFDSGSQGFRAIMNRGRGDALFRRLKPGSLLRLRGVAVVDPGYTRSLTPFAILVRSSDDVELLSGPPWWNARHLIALVLGMLLLGLLGNLLYHRIESLRLRAILQERENLAYEMHDTLAQSVAGIGFQLEAIRIGTPETLAKVHRQLDLASQLVRHSHAEARRSIDMLRPQQLESDGLLNALTLSARRLVEGGSVKISSTVTGEPRVIPLRVQDAFYRIGQEALANSVRHAHPKTIAIRLCYHPKAVELLIEDDGIGFVDGEITRSLGLQGMRRRAIGVSAHLDIVSTPDKGTQVKLLAPLMPLSTLGSWPVGLSRFIKGQVRYVRRSTESDSPSYR
jgi:signal transduction histidine kinase